MKCLKFPIKTNVSMYGIHFYHLSAATNTDFTVLLKRQNTCTWSTIELSSRETAEPRDKTGHRLMFYSLPKLFLDRSSTVSLACCVTSSKNCSASSVTKLP